MRSLVAILAAAITALYVAIAAAQESPQPTDSPASTASTNEDQSGYDQAAAPFLARHCRQCHAGPEPKGDFLLSELSGDLSEPDRQKRWLKALGRIKAGEMPPEKQPRPSDEEVGSLVAWVEAKVEAAESVRREAEGRTTMRRLNRVEYENTIRDLLGVHIDLQEMLPQDGSADGFDNNGEALHTSSFLLERYLEAADAALNVAIANQPQPPTTKKRYSCQDERHVKVTTESVFRKLDGTLVFFSSSAWQAVTMSQFYPPQRGKYRYRVSAYAYQSEGKPVSYRVDAGPMLMGQKNHLVGYFDAPADRPTVVEFVESQEARNTIRILPYGLASAQAVNKIGSDQYEGPGLAVEWVEIEGPLYDIWPPESHRRIFGELPQEPAPIYNHRDRVEVVSNDPLVDADRILRGFARRAFRRSVTDDDVQPFLSLVESRLADGYSFEQAVRVGLKGVLTSPDFLFLREPPGKLDDFALASRLSYFLWSTMPDEELLSLAEQGKLADPGTLDQQAERLLASPRAKAFTENFVGQWLKLRDIDFTAPDPRLYPEFDDMLKAAMVKETELFFDEVLNNDLSLTNFVDSDFAMLNERLAKHYGIPGIEGWEIRKTPLPPDSHRGGVLTMASVLKVTANGTTTSPVMRGAFVLDRLLGQPPPPPPDGVPAVEPDIRGATTIREQLAKHREIPSCASCHAQIDPPGFALESFDVIGGWRDKYRTLGNGEPVTVDGRRMPYHLGRPVDPGDALADGRRFANVDEFKRLLLADKDQLTRALAGKLLTYATGKAPDATDRDEIEAVVGKIRERDYGFRSLVHEIIRSEVFQRK